MYGDRLSRFLGLVRVILGQRNALKEWSSIERGVPPHWSRWNACARQPALFMTVRREIAEPCRESGVWSPEDLRPTRAVRRGSKGRVRRPKARRSSGSAIAAEVFMNNAG
jgi:hypothetical protein